MGTTPHISQNRLLGSLTDTSVSALLDSCHSGLVTGTILIEGNASQGKLELRAGAVEEAEFDSLPMREALHRLRALKSGSYEIRQQLPDLQGHLGDAASFTGNVNEVSVIELMQHCEQNALTCNIGVTKNHKRGEIRYRAGEIGVVSLNGEVDDEHIGEILAWRGASFKVTSPPLDAGIQGWPSVSREPTIPFPTRLSDLNLKLSVQPNPPIKGLLALPLFLLAALATASWILKSGLVLPW